MQRQVGLDEGFQQKRLLQQMPEPSAISWTALEMSMRRMGFLDEADRAREKGHASLLGYTFMHFHGHQETGDSLSYLGVPRPDPEPVARQPNRPSPLNLFDSLSYQESPPRIR